MTRKWPRCVHSSLIWMKDVNVFSGIEHILSQRALPYYSYIYTREDKSNFYLKFSICGRNYRIDDQQNFWQIVNFSLELVHAISCHYSHLLFSSIFFLNRKKICGDIAGRVIQKACRLGRLSLLWAHLL